MKKRSWNRGDVFIMVVLFYFLGILTSFLFYLFFIRSELISLPEKKEPYEDYSRLYTLDINQHAVELPHDKGALPTEQFPTTSILSQQSGTLDEEIWETTTIIRSALYQFVLKEGYMPQRLSELTQAFPKNYLTELPNDPITLSNDVVHQFTGTGGWVYKPVSGQMDGEWNKIIEQSLVPNVHLNSSIEFEPLEIYIVKDKHELRLVSGQHTLTTYKVGLGEKGSTPEGSFLIQKKVMNPNKWKETPSENPFGNRGMELSEYAIHGTNDPQSVGKDVSKGCIRMHNEDIAELYAMVPLYTSVEIIRENPHETKKKGSDSLSSENNQARNKQLYEQGDQLKEEHPGYTYRWAG